jgi:hypothetical protein
MERKPVPLAKEVEVVKKSRDSGGVAQYGITRVRPLQGGADSLRQMFNQSLFPI